VIRDGDNLRLTRRVLPDKINKDVAMGKLSTESTQEKLAKIAKVL
jgi:hypothetical protein